MLLLLDVIKNRFIRINYLNSYSVLFLNSLHNNEILIKEISKITALVFHLKKHRCRRNKLTKLGTMHIEVRGFVITRRFQEPTE